jgi:hypothetical protein
MRVNRWKKKLSSNSCEHRENVEAITIDITQAPAMPWQYSGLVHPRIQLLSPDLNPHSTGILSAFASAQNTCGCIFLTGPRG